MSNPMDPASREETEQACVCHCGTCLTVRSEDLRYFVGQALASSGWSMMSENTVDQNLAKWCWDIAESIVKEGEKRNK